MYWCSTNTRQLLSRDKEDYAFPAVSIIAVSGEEYAYCSHGSEWPLRGSQNSDLFV